MKQNNLAAHVGICMRQSCCSQSQYLSSVIAWRRQRGRRQAKDGNFQAPVGACATERARELHPFSKNYFISFHDGTTCGMK